MLEMFGMNEWSALSVVERCLLPKKNCPVGYRTCPHIRKSCDHTGEVVQTIRARGTGDKNSRHQDKAREG